MSYHVDPHRPGTVDPIKVAFVIDTLDARTGGTEGQLLRLIAGLDRARVEPELFCLESSPFLEHGGAQMPVRILNIHVSNHPALIGRIWAFSRLLRRERFDVVQTHFRDGNIVGVLAGWLAGVRVVISTRRGVPYWSTDTGLRFLRWLDRHATYFVANSMASKTRFTQAERLPADRVEVIYNGLDPELFRTLDAQERLALRQQLGIAGDAPVVGIVANLRPVKGLRDFLAAAQLVTRRFPRARFVIAGEGEDEQPLRQLTEQLGLQDNVLLLGAREDVPQLLQAFDVGVLSSHFESFSNSILEYVAAGLPVVVTDVGGAREVVREGENGFIVPPGDPQQMADRIERLLAHPEGARAWTRRRDLDEAFHTESMVRAYERLYQRLVTGNRALSCAGQRDAIHLPGASSDR